MSRWNATANIEQSAAVLSPPRIPATTPAFLGREDGRCSSVVGASERFGSEPSVRLKMPRFSRLDPSKLVLGRLSSVSFEVQPRSGNVRSPNDPKSGRRSAQVRPARCLTSFGRRTTFFYDYGLFGPAVTGLNGK